MTQVIDRRLNGRNKSAVNRQRFIRRFRSQIKRAVGEAISGRSIIDIDSGEKVNIPARDMSEPTFQHANGGRREAVRPGNREFIPGDKVKRPPNGGDGPGGEASDSGEGEDEFAFQLSREEFLELFFEDLALPDLVKTQLAKLTDFKNVRAGYSSDGVPANINVVRSLRGALARRMALRGPHIRRMHEAEAELEALQEASEEEQISASRRVALEEEISGVPGAVVRARGDRLVVATGSGALALIRVKPAGKRAMDAAAFLRGYPLEESTVLGS